MMKLRSHDAAHDRTLLEISDQGVVIPDDLTLDEAREVLAYLSMPLPHIFDLEQSRRLIVAKATLVRRASQTIGPEWPPAVER